MTPVGDRWLHTAFGLSSLALAATVAIAIGRDLDRPLRLDQRLIPALGVADRCEMCHTEHPGDWLDRHPPERFGCTPCHGGQGLATEATPAHRISLDWERPLHTNAERQAACGTCHLGPQPPRAPELARGRRALVARGCTGCHGVSGLPGYDWAPALDGLRFRATPGLVRARLGDPASVDPRHHMPVFRLTANEIEALVAHLWTLDGPAVAPLPEALTGDADRGRVAVAQRRCATCHRIEGRGGDTGPDLALAGQTLTPAYVFNLLTATHRLRPQSRMPDFELPPQEAADIAAYAAEQWVSDDGTLPWAALERPVVSERAVVGAKLFTDLGCGGCHAVAGKRVPPPGLALDKLGDRRVAELPLPADGTPASDVAQWVARKVARPTLFDQSGAPPSRMPLVPGIDDAEALAMGIALASLKAQPVPNGWLVAAPTASDPLPPGAVGRLVERFRCLVCHQLGGQGGDVAKVPLDGAGGRLRGVWLRRFLRDPVTVRLDQAERMPVLGMTAEEAELLGGWLAAVTGDDRTLTADTTQAPSVSTGRQLYQNRGCGACHVAQGQGPMGGPALDGVCWRLEPGYIRALLRDVSVLPTPRHSPQQPPLTRDEVGHLAAYLLSLPGPWPWPGEAQVGGCALPPDVTAQGL